MLKWINLLSSFQLFIVHCIFFQHEILKISEVKRRFSLKINDCDNIKDYNKSEEIYCDSNDLDFLNLKESKNSFDSENDYSNVKECYGDNVQITHCWIISELCTSKTLLTLINNSEIINFRDKIR